MTEKKLLCAKKIIKENIDKLTNERQETINYLLQNENFTKTKYLRNQIYYLTKCGEIYANAKDNIKFKLREIDIASLLQIDINVVKNQKRKSIILDENLPKDGRPFSLSNEELAFMKTYLKCFIVPPKKSEVRNFVQKKFGKYLDNRTFDTFLRKIEFQCQEATPMEANRYFCNPQKINYYYNTLTSFTRTNNIPSALCVNLDEEGHEPFSDAKKDYIITPIGSVQNKFPVDRKRSRTTFLGSIVADGTYLKPLIVVKRKTIETEIMKIFTPDHFMLECSENGYMTEKIFNSWLNSVFVKYVINKRKELGDEENSYQGKGMLICDGFSGHISDEFFKIMELCNFQVFFLPSHSSHITQPLDLCIFAQHKKNSKTPTKKSKTENEEEDFDEKSELLEIIKRLYTSWQKIATVELITSAWRQAGAIYEMGGPSYNYIRFNASKSRAYKDLLKQFEEENENMARGILKDGTRLFPEFKFPPITKEQFKEINIGGIEKKQAEIEEKMFKATIKIKEFNSPELKNKIKNLKQAIPDTKKNTVLENLLIATVPVEKLEDFTEKTVNRKGRPKKSEEPRPGLSLDAPKYYTFGFDERLQFELQSLGLVI